MAELLSLVASIIAVIGVGGQVTKAVRKLASLRDAPDVILALNNEISDLHLVVVAIEDVFRKQQNRGVLWSGNQIKENNVDITVTNSLQYTKDKSVELEALYCRIVPSAFSSGGSQIDKISWLQVQKRIKTVWLHERIKEMQKDLRSARLRLTTALGVLNS